MVQQNSKQGRPKVTLPNKSNLNTASTTSAQIDSKTRYKMIAEAAYYAAQHRGFAKGSEMEDWLKAERQIDETLRRRTQR